MAKLSARGRKELARVVKVVPSDDADIEEVTYRYALMSDQNILKRVTTKWRRHPGATTDRGWKVIEKFRYPTKREDFITFFALRGYGEES